jgi:hypothetical protein
MHELDPEPRRRRTDELLERDRPLAERLDHLMRNEELMHAADVGALADDHPLVRAAEEGVEWEVLTGPARSEPRGEEPGDERSETGHA